MGKLNDIRLQFQVYKDTTNGIGLCVQMLQKVEHMIQDFSKSQ